METFRKIEKRNHAAFIRIEGGFVLEIRLVVQIPQALVVGSLGTDFADAHHFVTHDADGVYKTVDVPELEQGNVQADVGGVEVLVLDDEVEETVEVFDVVHGNGKVKYKISSGQWQAGFWWMTWF